jgi:hypothetical protein
VVNIIVQHTNNKTKEKDDKKDPSPWSVVEGLELGGQ